jgi:nucleoside-diphosphate-sugar epimerase
VRTQGSAVIADAAAAAGIRRLVQEAVTFVYPDQGDEWITEQVPPAPNRKSQSATMTATGNALRFAETGGGVTVVLRFGLLYGPDRNSAELLARVHRGKRAVLGRPGGWLAPLHPDDAAAAVVAALACPGGIYNVCETPVPRSEWAAAVGREAHGEPVDYDVGAPARFYPTFVQRLAGSRVEPLTRSQRVSNAAFVKATGWRTRHDVLQGSWLDEGSAGRTTTDSSPAANS